MADWGGLPGGVVALFAKRLQLIEDFIAFRSTCSSWRKATSLTDFDKSCPRLPLVLLDKYAYDIDRKFPDYIYRSPRRNRADQEDVDDEDIQIHDHSDDENDEGDENDEIGESNGDEDNSETETDEIDESNGDQDNSETEIDESNGNEEKSEIDEIHQSNGDEDNSEIDEIDESNGDEDNSETDESNVSNGDEEKSLIDENYENDKGDQNDEIVAEDYENVKGEENDQIVAVDVNYEDVDEINKSNGNEEKSEIDENHEIVESNSENDEIKKVNVDSDEGDKHMFFSLSKGKGCMISLPEARGMECIGSKGWLIMVNRCTGDICLFHPLTRARITLPKAPPEVEFPIFPKHIRCAVLSASPSETSDYVVMVAYVHKNYISGSCVVFWKPGNLTWTRVESLPRCVEDLTYYNGKFYALTWVSEVWMCDISGPNPKDEAIKIIELPWKWRRKCAQLVECGGRLLVVAPFFCHHYDMESYHDLKMVELDVIRGSYSTVTNLGSSTVFLGRNETFSVDVNQFPPGIIEPNRIYFSDRSYRIASRGHDSVPRPHLGLAAWGVWINF